MQALEDLFRADKQAHSCCVGVRTRPNIGSSGLAYECVILEGPDALLLMQENELRPPVSTKQPWGTQDWEVLMLIGATTLCCVRPGNSYGGRMMSRRGLRKIGGPRTESRDATCHAWVEANDWGVADVAVACVRHAGCCKFLKWQ